MDEVTPTFHTCSETIWVRRNQDGSLETLDSSQHVITVCPHCFKDLSIDDLRTMMELEW